MVESTELVKRCFPEVFEEGFQFFMDASEEDNHILIEKRGTDKDTERFDVFQKTITRIG